MRHRRRVCRLSIGKNLPYKVFSRLLHPAHLLQALSMTRKILADGETARGEEIYAPQSRAASAMQ